MVHEYFTIWLKGDPLFVDSIGVPSPLCFYLSQWFPMDCVSICFICFQLNVWLLNVQCWRIPSPHWAGSSHCLLWEERRAHYNLEQYCCQVSGLWLSINPDLILEWYLSSHCTYPVNEPFPLHWITWCKHVDGDLLYCCQADHLRLLFVRLDCVCPRRSADSQGWCLHWGCLWAWGSGKSIAVPLRGLAVELPLLGVLVFPRSLLPVPGPVKAKRGTLFASLFTMCF